MGVLVKKIALLITAAAASFSQNSFAQTNYLVNGYITFEQGGWYNSYLRVQLGGVQFNNPDNCSANDGFITDP